MRNLMPGVMNINIWKYETICEGFSQASEPAFATCHLFSPYVHPTLNDHLERDLPVFCDHQARCVAQ